MDRLASYEMFVMIAREGSFARAARRLNLSPQAVTRGISALEQRLGLRLFLRSTRAVSLTTEGAGVLPRIERILGELADSERVLSGMLAEPRGELSVSAPVAFGQMHVQPVVAELLARWPALDVRLQLLDRNVRLIEEGIDIAVRIGALADSALRTTQIGVVRQVIVASPAYLARRGVPKNPQDLASHDVIASTGPRGQGEWRIGGQTEPHGLRRRLRVNTVGAALDAAEAGLGLANFLSYQASGALNAGRLIEVLQPEQPEPIPVSLVFEPGRAGSAATRAFIEAMRDYARSGHWS
jgi:DNA-binding transcriptional LysR family regulator